MVPEIHDRLPADILEKGSISIATDANYPPCSWFLEDGTMVGFEVDIWNALAQTMGVTAEPTSIDFGGILPGIAAGRYDMGQSCFSDRPEREEVVDFVNHVFTYGNSYFYLADNSAITPGDFLSLCGLRTAGQSGTDFLIRLAEFSDYCVENGKAPIEIGEFPQQVSVLLALFSGRIDFTISEASAVEQIRANNAVEVGSIHDPLQQNVYLGIIVSKEKKELQLALNAALKAIAANGTYDQILDKWKIPHAKLPEFGFNMATTKPLN